VIVNASLGGSPESACNDAGIFERRCLLEWAPQRSIPEPGIISQENSHVELLRDCECVPGRWR
jgi:hypothetical protein